MMNISKKYLHKTWNNAMEHNKLNILRLKKKLLYTPNNLLDLGCANGSWTNELLRAFKVNQCYGIDITESDLSTAKDLGIIPIRADLSSNLPFKNNFFDLIHANQVIEHVPNIDLFVSEIYRVLSSKGYAVISTENGSSWCNIFASILGFQPFSLTNFSVMRGG